eukprot:2913338-Rhodomonas_salina.1
MARGLRLHPAIRGEAWVGMSVSGLEPEAAPGYPWRSLVAAKDRPSQFIGRAAPGMRLQRSGVVSS